MVILFIWMPELAKRQEGEICEGNNPDWRRCSKPLIKATGRHAGTHTHTHYITPRQFIPHKSQPSLKQEQPETRKMQNPEAYAEKLHDRILSIGRKYKSQMQMILPLRSFCLNIYACIYIYTHTHTSLGMYMYKARMPTHAHYGSTSHTRGKRRASGYGKTCASEY